MEVRGEHRGDHSFEALDGSLISKKVAGCRAPGAKMRRHAPAYKTNPDLSAARFRILLLAVFPHRALGPRRRGQRHGGDDGHVVSGVCRAGHLPDPSDRSGDSRLEVAARALRGLELCDSRALCSARVPRDLGADSRFLRIESFAIPLGEAFGFPTHPRATTLFLAIPCYAIYGVIRSTSSALGEEIGWRGFLFPRLVGRVGFTVGCVLTGCIWALWHYPGLLFADYNAGTKPAYALSCFTLMVIADSFIMGWLRLKSGSLWPAAILHASHNLFIQAIFDRMTSPVGRTLYVTTEFGAGWYSRSAAWHFIFGRGGSNFRRRRPWPRKKASACRKFSP